MNKTFLAWFKKQTFSFEFCEWVEHSGGMVDAIYARFKGWDKKNFQYQKEKDVDVKDNWPDVYDELANDPRS